MLIYILCSYRFWNRGLWSSCTLGTPHILSHSCSVIGVWGLRYLTNSWALENSLRNTYMTALLSMIIVLTALPHLWPLGIYMHENKENKLSLAFCLLGEIWRNALPRMPSSLRHQKKKKLSFKDLPNVSIAENAQKRFFFSLMWS